MLEYKCFYCGLDLWQTKATDLWRVCWVDPTGGDCCSGDDALRNENGVHIPKLNPHKVRVVLDVLGEGYGAYASGSMRPLVEAALRFDDINLAKLALGFPQIVDVINVYRFLPGGLDALKEMALNESTISLAPTDNMGET